MPQKFGGEAPKQQISETTHKILFACNIMFPLAAGVFVYLYTKDLENPEKQPSMALTILDDVAIDLVLLVQLISGVILVRSVVRIRDFFKSKDEVDQLDTKGLFYHAISFTLYLFVVSAYFVAW